MADDDRVLTRAWRHLERPVRILVYLLIALTLVMIYHQSEYLVVHLFNVLLLFVFAAIIALLLTPVIDRMEMLAIFKGRPGGLLWFDPTVESRTRLCDGDIPRSRLDDLRSGKEVADRAEARRYVDNLRDESSRRVSTTPTVTSSP